MGMHGQSQDSKMFPLEIHFSINRKSSQLLRDLGQIRLHLAPLVRFPFLVLYQIQGSLASCLRTPRMEIRVAQCSSHRVTCHLSSQHSRTLLCINTFPIHSRFEPLVAQALSFTTRSMPRLDLPSSRTRREPLRHCQVLHLATGRRL